MIQLSVTITALSPLCFSERRPGGQLVNRVVGEQRVEAVRIRLLDLERPEQRPGTPQRGVRHRLPDGRARVFEQGREDAGRNHEEAEPRRLDQVLGPVPPQGGERSCRGRGRVGSGDRREAIDRAHSAVTPQHDRLAFHA